jgi:hypothetical protein
MQLWIDGASKQTITGIDNYDRFVNSFYFQFGAVYISTTASGTLYMDELVINDDGSEIGPVSTGAAGNPYYAYAQQ